MDRERVSGRRSLVSSGTRSRTTSTSTSRIAASTAPRCTTPLALAVAIAPSLVRTEPVAVEVELTGEWTTAKRWPIGTGVWRARKGRRAPRIERRPNLDVAVDVEADAFVRRFVQWISALGAASR